MDVNIGGKGRGKVRAELIAGMYPVPLWAVGSVQETSLTRRHGIQPFLSFSADHGGESCLTELILVLPAVLLGSTNNLWKYLSFKQIRSLQAKRGWLRVCYSLRLLSGKDSEAIQQHFRHRSVWAAATDIRAETQAHCGSLVRCSSGADQVSHVYVYTCAEF